ncbi:hypothetical protein EBR25_04945 [bacterium]|nr:hypothetical protein [bacterium]
MKNYRYDFGRQNGASLLSLLLVLFMSTTTIVLTGRGLTDARQRAVLYGDVQKIKWLIEEGEAISLLEHKPMTLQSQTHTIRLLSQDGGVIRRQAQLSPHITATFPSNGIVFYPHLVNTPARILIELNHHICEIVLSLRGRLRSECSE